MKTHIAAVAFAASCLLVLSCESDNHPLPESIIKPIKVEEDGYVRELIYSAKSGQLSSIKSTSTMPDKSTIETVQQVEYDQHGRPARTLIDNHWRMEYTYKGSRIVRTDEFRDSQPHQVPLFTYNISGRMVEMVTLRDEPTGVQPVSKVSNVYDLEGNLMESVHFSFEDGRFNQTSSFIYSGYDNMLSNEHFFSAHALNPLLMFHANNPSRMVVKSFNGAITSVEDYTYQYNIQNYPIERYTTVTFPYNGNSGIYKTEYFYDIKSR